MSTEELLRYDQEWEAMRRALGTRRLVFDFRLPACADRSTDADQTCNIRPGLLPMECVTTHA